MNGINKVILVGTLGKDPEMRYMPSGGAVASISIATSEKWKDKTSGEQKEKTEWHNIVAFNRLAEIMGEYLKKGSQVYIEGKLQTDKYQAKDGTDRYSTKVQAFTMQMLGGKSDNTERTTQNKSNDNTQDSTTNPGFDDDIPF